jgi:hypothetical protein
LAASGPLLTDGVDKIVDETACAQIAPLADGLHIAPMGSDGILSQRYPLVFDYLYAACVTGPLLLHRSIYLRIFGCLIRLFFGVSILVFNPARYSVWCFFAAVCSIVLYLFVASRNGLGRRHSAPMPNDVPAIDPQKI